MNNVSHSACLLAITRRKLPSGHNGIIPYS